MNLKNQLSNAATTRMASYIYLPKIISLSSRWTPSGPAAWRKSVEKPSFAPCLLPDFSMGIVFGKFDDIKKEEEPKVRQII